MTTLTPNTAPPPNYYAANLRGVVLHLAQHQADVLGAAAQSDLVAILELKEQPLRLLARLITRSTPIVRIDSLVYDEVGDTARALIELVDQNLVDINPLVAADTLLDRLRVAEIRQLFPRRQKSCKTKRALIEMVVDHYGEAQVCGIISGHQAWLQLRIRDSLQRMLIAYFGSANRDLSDFVVRDLGLMRFEGYPLESGSRVFENAADMQRYVDLRALQRIPQRQRYEALVWLEPRLQPGSPPPAPSSGTGATLAIPTNPDIRRRLDRLLIAWGRDFERCGENNHALRCYRLAQSHPARERQVRILQKLGRAPVVGRVPDPNSGSFIRDPVEASQALLAQMLANPVGLTEALFARKHSTPQIAQGNPQKGSRPSATTRWPETVWRVASSPFPNVEARVLDALTANAGVGWHVENALFTTLLGLAFWECLFAPVKGMFSHPFQSGPRDLYWPDFRERRQAQFDRGFKQCAEPGALWQRIYRRVANRYGVSCSLINWHLATPAILRSVEQSMTPDQLLAIFDYMLSDLSQTRTGLPDLFVAYAPKRFELVEVKGPGDQLQPNQRVWLAQLVALDIPCRVINLRAVGT